MHICTHGLPIENPLKILFPQLLYRLYFAVRETSPARSGATVRLMLEIIAPSDAGYSCFESVQSGAIHCSIFRRVEFAKPRAPNAKKQEWSIELHPMELFWHDHGAMNPA
jgi:hypothetical protein